MNITTITADGKTKDQAVSGVLSEEKWRPELVRQVILSLQSNRRANTAHSKDRSAVRGADQKPWRQKGTGRARHGSPYSPIWRGGGVTFGPLNTRNYKKKISRSMRQKALASALYKRIEDGEVFNAVLPTFDAPKTSTAKKWLADIAATGNLSEADLQKSKNAVLVVVPDSVQGSSKNISLSLRNISNIHVVSALDLNVEDVLRTRAVILADNALDILSDRLAK